MSEAPHKWKVGDPVVVCADANGWGGGKFVVKKVGRKYLTINNGYRDRRFDLADGREQSDGVGGYCVAMTPAAFLAAAERGTLQKAVRDATHHLNAFSLDQLRRIVAIFEETR